MLLLFVVSCTLSQGGKVTLGEAERSRARIVEVRKAEASRPTWTLLVSIVSD